MPERGSGDSRGGQGSVGLCTGLAFTEEGREDRLESQHQLGKAGSGGGAEKQLA